MYNKCTSNAIQTHIYRDKYLGEPKEYKAQCGSVMLKARIHIENNLSTTHLLDEQERTPKSRE